jgi:hypothetical protein
MPEVSFPGGGQDGEQPPPAVPARDETAATPPGGPRDEIAGAPSGPDDGWLPGAPATPDDWDPEAEQARFIADLDAGRRRIPEEREIESRPPVTISLGDAADVDPAELAVMLGPDGLGGEVFAQDRPADALRPGPLLAALTERAAADLGRLTDDQVLGAVSAARRLAARAEYLELTAVAEFTRRQDARYAAAVAAKVPPGRRDGEFADAELGYELVTSGNAARDRMDMADHLRRRLPATNAALAAGVIDGSRAFLIWRYTRVLSGADAAHADQVLTEAAPHLRYDQLARKAMALAMKLDPEAVKRGKDKARADRQRVEARREDSGNACLNGRELPVEDVLASKAHIDAMAAALRNGGLQGNLRHLRALAYIDLTQGRNPLDRLTRPAGDPDAAGSADGGRHGERDPGAGQAGRGDGAEEQGAAGHSGGCLDEDPYADDDDYTEDGPAGTSGPTGNPAPFPALINLVVPADTVLGLGNAPGDAGGWGLTDADETRRLVQAASMDPRTRWCLTVTGADGTAVAHGCARGRHLFTPGGGGRDGPAALTELLRDLNVTLIPIAKGSCEHAVREDRYTPSRRLQDLVRARTTRCTAPGCGAQACYCDLDHSIPYPAGITCQCDLGPVCRRHHRAKQAPGWTLEQPEPGIFRWTTPSGRVYTTRPTVYDV